MAGTTMRLVVTGSTGLIGWHAAAHIHAANCAAQFVGKDTPFDLVLLDRHAFSDDSQLSAAVNGADAILHFAGVNRASEDEVEEGNPAIARRLVEACAAIGNRPHIVYANSTHAGSNTPYGRSKRNAEEFLGKSGGPYTNLILPHIFGECARPRYNNVSATFIEAVINGHVPDINPSGKVDLLHAGAAAKVAIDAVLSRRTGEIRPIAHETSVPELFAMFKRFHEDYKQNIFPDLDDPFVLALFNSYRAALYPNGFPHPVRLSTDGRGTLFEAVKSKGGGQTFLSTTGPGVTRGDHFHLNKVERFLVIQGEALIRIRKVLTNTAFEYHVSGGIPSIVDIPTLHTHSIENLGDTPLITLFWSHEFFNPVAPDTYFDPVLKV